MQKRVQGARDKEGYKLQVSSCKVRKTQTIKTVFSFSLFVFRLRKYKLQIKIQDVSCKM